MLSPFWLCRIALCVPLLTVWVLPGLAHAQVAPKPRSPLITGEELQTLLGGPTLVTYSGKDVPVEEAGNALLETIGFPRLSPQRYRERGVPKTISVDWKGVPFWTAAREFEALTGLTWHQGDRGLDISPDSPTDVRETSGVPIADSPWVQIAGAQIKHSSRTSVLLGAQGDKPNEPTLETELTLTAYLDPKLKVDLGGLSATGVVLPPATTPGAGGVERYSSSYLSRPHIATQVEVQLPPGVRSGSVVPLVSGILRTTLMAQTQVWKVPDLVAAVGTKQMVGTAEYTIEGARVEANRLSLQLSGTWDTPLGPDGQPEPIPPFYRAGISKIIQVRDAQGRLLEGSFITERGSGEPDGRRKGVLTIPLTVADRQGNPLSGPYAFEWTLPVSTRTLETPFEIKDLKVP